MAYASVASLLVTIDLLNYHGDPSIPSRFKHQITSLHKHTSFLQSFLEDDDPNRAKNWEETIRDVTDRAEEIIDILVSDSLLKSSKSEGVDELERVTEEMESTVDRVKGRSIKAKAEPDKELMRIITLLLEGSHDRETISIVGMGGMGKSALAANAYNHPLVVEHFDVRAWSIVSSRSSPRGIIMDLLRCMNVESVPESDGEAIETLFTSLLRRRYLIVFYDMWSEIPWDSVRRAFPDNGKGSRIISTMRSLSFGSINSHVHQMSFLSEEHSWDLLRNKIIRGEPCPSQLEHYGKIISDGCRGHQLTIEVVSGILASDLTKAAWEDVSENIKIACEEDDFALLQMLSLSYTYLPHHLRSCFWYLGCFAEGQEIRVSTLVKMWVAEGFLNQSESKSFQETGEENVEILVRRSLVSVSKRKSNGRIKSITVHSIVRDMCLGQARMGNFIHDGGTFQRIEQLSMTVKLQSCRRVSSSNYSRDFLKGVYDSTVRTIILHSIDNEELGISQSIGNVRLLRILDLSNARDYDLPKQVFRLFHLRFLAFHSGFSISKAISNLQNLQTLIVCPRESGRAFCMLPKVIWRMPQLRHLLNFSFNLPIPTLKQGEAENSTLENLEMLSRLVDFVCSRENLKMIPNVKKLNVFYTNSFKDVAQDIELHNLIYLHKLEVLKIEMEWPFHVEKLNKMSFAFPPTLKKLSLCGVQLPWEDMKVVGSLPSLEVLKLRNHACVGKTWKTSEGGFSRLTYLMIEGSDLEEWITESCHFPRLKSLVLHSCLNLSEVSYEIGEIPTLRFIELDRKNNFLFDLTEEIQYNRKSLGYDLLQIHFKIVPRKREVRM